MPTSTQWLNGNFALADAYYSKWAHAAFTTLIRKTYAGHRCISVWRLAQCCLIACKTVQRNRLIACALWSLLPTERWYLQLAKEALATCIIFEATKFHQYLLGRHFTILSDHKSLIYSFASDKPILPKASACIQGGPLLLSTYNYSIRHQPGKAHANMDTLSRLPLSTTTTVTQPTRDYPFVCVFASITA